MWEKRIKSEHPGGCEAPLLCALSQSTSCRMLGKIYFLDLQYVTAEWKPAFLSQAREFLFFPLLPREATQASK